ncbi:MAG TPA: hypothetical protein P5123_00860 [Spirochaetota bacterium]|nr:hypothetical protein [Spirochaetota bacterium]
MNAIIKITGFAMILLGSVSIAFAETLGSSNDLPFNENQEEVNVSIKQNYASQKKHGKKTETLFGSEEFSVTGFGGPIYSMSNVEGKNYHFVGGRGGAVFNNTFVLGGAGYGLTYPYKRQDFSDSAYQGSEDEVEMGYGGLLIGFNMFQKSIINVSFLTVVGAGGLVVTDSRDDESDADSDYNTSNSDEFFVCEPTLMMHMNITKWMRIGAGVSYRYTRGIDLAEFSDSDFSNISYVVAAEFGWF